MLTLIKYNIIGVHFSIRLLNENADIQHNSVPWHIAHGTESFLISQ
jgi:hypothetical protein